MKKIIMIISIIALMLSSYCFAANASLQSRPDRARLVSQTANQFFIKARNMEDSNGVLGLNATIDQDTGRETTGLPNNIDAHMVKNTEYGAAAILSVSQYGYQEKVPETSGVYTSVTNYTLGDSTTGPAGTESYYYGLFDMSNNYNVNSNYKYTYTSTMHTGTTTETGAYQYTSKLYNASRIPENSDLAKYVDLYPNSATGSYYYGDATTETARWRGATYANFVDSTKPVFRRLRGFFGYYSYVGGADSSFGSRASLVCGAGL